MVFHSLVFFLFGQLHSSCFTEKPKGYLTKEEFIGNTQSKFSRLYPNVNNMGEFTESLRNPYVIEKDIIVCWKFKVTDCYSL